MTTTDTTSRTVVQSFDTVDDDHDIYYNAAGQLASGIRHGEILNGGTIEGGVAIVMRDVDGSGDYVFVERSYYQPGLELAVIERSIARLEIVRDELRRMTA